MAVSEHVPSTEAMAARPLWTCAILGVVLIIAGVLALDDVVYATIVSVKLIRLPQSQPTALTPTPLRLLAASPAWSLRLTCPTSRNASPAWLMPS